MDTKCVPGLAFNFSRVFAPKRPSCDFRQNKKKRKSIRYSLSCRYTRLIEGKHVTSACVLILVRVY
jgi:hypothetical protein